MYFCSIPCLYFPYFITKNKIRLLYDGVQMDKFTVETVAYKRLPPCEKAANSTSLV